MDGGGKAGRCPPAGGAAAWPGLSGLMPTPTWLKSLKKCVKYLEILEFWVSDFFCLKKHTAGPVGHRLRGVGGAQFSFHQPGDGVKGGWAVDKLTRNEK